jgi:hypothetical protein
MFVGMEHIMLSNHVLADEALNASNRICDGDPLLINERGVMAFNHGEFVYLFILCNPNFNGLFPGTNELLYSSKNPSTLRRLRRAHKIHGLQPISIWGHASAS